MALVDETRMEETGFRMSEATAGDFFALLKPRVMSLVVFTAFVGLVAAPTPINPAIAVIAILAIAIGAGASGALNMWYDADIDAKMARTAARPVPSGRVTPGEALGFGMTLSVGSVIVMALAVNNTAAFLLAFTIFFYAVIYTMWLKRSTPQNIVIGGAAGAFPPMIGWAAVTGSVSLESVLLFLIILFWTPPHFWALALYRTQDYARAGVPMMPVVAGEVSTRWQVLLYTLVLVPLGIAPWALGFAGPVYGTVAIVTGAIMLGLAVQVLRERSPAERASRNMFAFSILYLFLLYAVLLVERGWGGLLARLAA